MVEIVFKGKCLIFVNHTSRNADYSFFQYTILCTSWMNIFNINCSCVKQWYIFNKNHVFYGQKFN